MSFSDMVDALLAFLNETEVSLTQSSEELKQVSGMEQTLGEMSYILAKIRGCRYGLKDCQEAFARLPAITEEMRNRYKES